MKVSGNARLMPEFKDEEVERWVLSKKVRDRNCPLKIELLSSLKKNTQPSAFRNIFRAEVLRKLTFVKSAVSLLLHHKYGIVQKLTSENWMHMFQENACINK